MEAFVTTDFAVDVHYAVHAQVDCDRMFLAALNFETNSFFSSLAVDDPLDHSQELIPTGRGKLVIASAIARSFSINVFADSLTRPSLFLMSLRIVTKDV